MSKMYCAAAAALMACTGAAFGAEKITEVSQDGLLRVAIDPAAPQRPSSVERGGVPFGATPDWSLSLRRQVGAVRIGDLNGDHRNDLAVGCYISNSFPPYTDWRDMIFYNSGSTLPAAPSWIAADQIHTGDLQIGDINGDTFPDLFAVSGGTSFSPPRIYFGAPGGPSTSPGWTATPPSAGWATSGILFDIDGDHDLDALTTNQGVSPNAFRPMYFFRNNAGVLESTPSWQSAESSIQNTAAAYDYDNDGDLDIAVAKWVNFQSGIYRNNSGTLETTPAWTVGTTAGDRGVTVGDVDHAGLNDMVLGQSPAKLYTNVAGVLTPSYTMNPTFNGLQENVLHDVDRDGDLDYAEVHFSNGVTHIYLNNAGTISSTPDWTYDASEVGNALAFGDINGDGWDDLAIGYSGDTSVRVFFAVPPPPPPCPGDANGDLNIDSADLSVLLGQFGSSVLPGTGADFNGDGQVNSADLSVLLGAFGTSC